ncbi:hypothetical protein NDU88_002978, partial [Pleurodeles waltl]
KPTTRVIQLDAIPARVGASVTIPCGFTYSGEVDSLNDVKVYWKAGNGSLCLEFKYIYNLTGNFEHEDYKHRVTLVTDPRGNGTSSLHITDLREADSKRYCCILRVKGKWMSSSHGTELIVGDLKPITGYDVTQSEVIEAQNDSVAVDCKFTYPQDRDPLWIGVFWVVGVKWDEIIHYPSQESINLGYERKSPELSSTLSLPANSVTDISNKLIYCLVVFRFCSGNNGFTSVIQQGAGTRLEKK